METYIQAANFSTLPDYFNVLWKAGTPRSEPKKNKNRVPEGKTKIQNARRQQKSRKNSPRAKKKKECPKAMKNARRRTKTMICVLFDGGGRGRERVGKAEE